jgi:hypothetical protein
LHTVNFLRPQHAFKKLYFDILKRIVCQLRICTKVTTSDMF